MWEVVALKVDLCLSYTIFELCDLRNTIGFIILHCTKVLWLECPPLWLMAWSPGLYWWEMNLWGMGHSERSLGHRGVKGISCEIPLVVLARVLLYNNNKHSLLLFDRWPFAPMWAHYDVLPSATMPEAKPMVCTQLWTFHLGLSI